MSDAPLVSCIVTAYNYGGFIARALDSVLAQDYPADRLEVIVVDDGSTDDTPHVVEPYLDRIRYVRKENGGLNSSYDRGLAEANGDFFAFLDADDMWPPDKVRRQVEFLSSRPEVGLVYGDMEVIDEHDRPLHPSYFAMHQVEPHRGRVLGALMRGNFITGGSMMVRASLRPAFHPIGEMSAWPDWWVATRVAAVADVDYMTEPLYRYRRHGTNMGFGLDAAQEARTMRDHDLPFRRWLLSTTSPGQASAPDLVRAYSVFRGLLGSVGARLQIDPRELAPLRDGDREAAGAAVAAAERAFAAGDVDGAACLAVNALARDPWSGHGMPVLKAVAAAASGGGEHPSPSPAGDSLPTISCVVAAYNQERFVGRALDSVFGQDYPADRLEVIVVDDGSTDGTAAALAPYMERIRYVHQENGGHLAAYSTGIGHATGALIALLDGDDEWLPGKLRTQAAMLAARPELGMVYGDMQVVDDEGRELYPSYWARNGIEARAGSAHALGGLMHNNFAQTSTIMVRAALRDRFHPIPDWARAQDWWIGVRVSQVAGIDRPRGVVTRYRMHGENLWFGTDTRKHAELRGREIAFRRWMLAGIESGQVALQDLVNAYNELQVAAAVATQGLGAKPATLEEVDAAQRDACLDAVEAALDSIERDNLPEAVHLLVSASAHDPSNTYVRIKLEFVLRRLSGQPPREDATDPGRTATALEDARTFVTLAFADELEQSPDQLAAYAREFGEDDDATLVIYAPGRAEEELLAKLTEALDAAGVDLEHGPDLLALAGERSEGIETALAHRMHAVFSSREAPERFRGRPRFDAQRTDQLRALADRRFGFDGVGRSLSFCIKICAPDWQEAPRWGDLHFARAVQDELELRGHRCIVQVVPEWDDAAGRACDVAIHLRGLYPFVPKQGQVSVLWNISHPDLLTPAECDRYDLVLTASAKLPAKLAPLTSTPVQILEQATDPAVFFPDRDPAFEREIVFVGNSRGVMRPILRDLLPTSRDLAVWGGGWDGFIDPRYVVDTYLPNEQVRSAYSSAGLVLNDHWDDMREWGFISNRVYDALAAGAVLVSDDFEALRERFGDSLLTYRSPDELREIVDRCLESREERERLSREGRELVLARHTFAHRVDDLLRAVAERMDTPSSLDAVDLKLAVPEPTTRV